MFFNHCCSHFRRDLLVRPIGSLGINQGARHLELAEAFLKFHTKIRGVDWIFSIAANVRCFTVEQSHWWRLGGRQPVRQVFLNLGQEKLPFFEEPQKVSIHSEGMGAVATAWNSILPLLRMERGLRPPPHTKFSL